MARTLTSLALAGALALVAAPAWAEPILTLPFVGDIEHPDLDPIHILNGDPAPAAAPAPAKPMKKHHKMKKHMKKKM